MLTQAMWRLRMPDYQRATADLQVPPASAGHPGLFQAMPQSLPDLSCRNYVSNLYINFI